MGRGNEHGDELLSGFGTGHSVVEVVGRGEEEGDKAGSGLGADCLPIDTRGLYMVARIVPCTA